MQKTIAYLQEASKRLNRVVIENVDLSVFIKRDRESALFYCDPPYYDAKNIIQTSQPEDHVRLRDTLSGLKVSLSCLTMTVRRSGLVRGYDLIEVDRQDNL